MLEYLFMMHDSITDVVVLLRLVGRRVAVARDHRGLGQEEVAERSGLPVAILAALERGEYGIEVDELHRVADVLGVAMTELLPAEAEVRGAAEALRDDESQTQQDPAGGTSAGS
jgi:transcriptional regulator with XRE-family HTH domain